MNSFELVKAAFKFQDPERIPVMYVHSLINLMFRSDVFQLSTLPSSNYHPGWGEHEEGIFPRSRAIVYRWNKPEWAKLPKYRGMRNGLHLEQDEWGCFWEIDPQHQNMGHPSKASLTNWENLEQYMNKFAPKPDEAKRYTLVAKSSKVLGRGKYHLVNLPGPFTIAMNMVGFTKFLEEHRRHPEQIEKLFTYIIENIILTMKNWKKYATPHGFMIYDDLGEQNRAFMSVKMFNKFYKPVFGRLYETAHELGCEFIHHSCGKIDELIPSLIEWGLDALELDSPRMIGYSNLRPFRGKIMFWGCVDIQTIYTHGTPEECYFEVREMIRNLGTQHGGFGAYIYPPKDLRADQKNMLAYEKGIRELGNYKKMPLEWWIDQNK